ncbi:MAG TPA: hypothetical protein VHV78_09540 [Gemmatimonadaceae bacterium]|nr:hypothetical protein [Gemmatimonadaceae bacterium]
MRPFIRFFIGSAATCLVASCSDAPTAPSSNATQQQQSASGPAFDFLKIGGPAVVPGIIQVTGKGGTFTLGQYTLTFPANAICDPTKSTYGPTEWNKPCTTLGPGQSVFIFAVLSLGSNGLGADFSPALRFSPSATVTISTNAFVTTIKSNAALYAANHSALNSLVLYYAPSAGAAVQADFLNDPSVVTHVNLSTGQIWRRVKHFSGYIMTSGAACTPSPDTPDCVQVDNSGN